MRLNNPETVRSAPPTSWSMEKLSSMKSVPGAKQVGDHWSRGSFFFFFDLEVLNGTSEYFLFELFYCTCINISHTSFFYKNWIILGILFGKIFCFGGFFFSFGLVHLDLYPVTCMKIIILTSSPWWTCFTTINNVAISIFLHMSFSATLNIFIL